MPPAVSLRPVQEADLVTFYQNQLDPEALAMAEVDSFKQRDSFMAHWAGVMADESITARTIVCDGEVAGSICCWQESTGRRFGYWLGRTFWGRGVATAAVAQFLAEITVRPLAARVAKHNVASLRVLEKFGFEITRAERVPLADGRVVEKHILELRSTGG